jgi:phage terminase Nu1 subunit (DNA packaging protein)
MTTQKLVTQTEFARICGVNKSTVTRWLQNGRIQLAKNGLIDPVAAAVMRAATESPQPHHQARKTQFDEQHEAAQGVAPDATPATSQQTAQNGPQARFTMPQGGQDTPQAEKLGIALKIETYKLQKAKAETANVELDKMAGALCERSEVDYALNDFGSALRALLEAMPDRLASQLSTLHGDVSAMHRAIEEAMHDALASMAETMTRKTQRLNP